MTLRHHHCSMPKRVGPALDGGHVTAISHFLRLAAARLHDQINTMKGGTHVRRTAYRFPNH